MNQRWSKIMLGPKPNGKLKNLLERVSYRQWLIAAVLVSCFLGVVVFMSFGSEDTSSDKNHPQTVKVVVAKQDIPARTVIKEEMVKVIEIPADLLPDGALSDISEVVDCPVSVPVQQGDVLTDKKVLKDMKLAGFTGTIPPDCRAISVGITDITGVAGFAKPGDYVDVMIVRKGGNGQGASGEILLQNVLLLGINKTGATAGNVSKGDSGNKDKDKKSKDDKGSSEGDLKAAGEQMATATLAVTPDEALKLATASQQGTVYLVLRPYQPKDSFIIDTEYHMEGDVVPQQSAPASSAPSTPAPSYSAPAPSYSAPAPAAAPAPASSAPSYSSDSVEVINGVDSSYVEVR